MIGERGETADPHGEETGTGHGRAEPGAASAHAGSGAAFGPHREAFSAGEAQPGETSDALDETHRKGTDGADLSLDVSSSDRNSPLTRIDPPTIETMVRRWGAHDSFAALCEAVVCEIVEKDLRLVPIACRTSVDEIALAIAASLSEGEIFETAPGIGVTELLDALPRPRAGNTRILVLRRSLAGAPPQQPSILSMLSVRPGVSTGDVEALLTERAVRLIVAIEEGPRTDWRDLVALDPRPYMIPWIEPFVARLADPYLGLPRALRTEIAATIRQSALDEQADWQAREVAAYHHLNVCLDGKAFLNAPREEIDRALKASEQGMWGARQGLEKSIEDLFAFATAGRIPGLLFTIGLLLGRVSPGNLAALAERLLASQPAPSVGHLPEDLRETWFRDCEEAERFGQARPALPGWHAIHDHDPDGYSRQAHLVVRNDLCRPEARFNDAVAAAVLARTQPTFLSRLLALTLDPGFFQPSAAFFRADLVRLWLRLVEATGLRPQDGTVSPGQHTQIALFAEAISRARAPVFLTDRYGERFLHDRPMCEDAAEILGEIVAFDAERGLSSRHLVNAILLNLAERLGYADLTVILGRFLLDRGGAWDDGVAAADLAHFAVGPQLGTGFNRDEWRDQILSALVEAQDRNLPKHFAPDQGGYAPLTTWLSGLRTAPAPHGLPAQAIATHCEEHAVQLDIVFPPPPTEHPPSALAVEAFYGSEEAADGRSWSLIERMLVRDPSSWLRDRRLYLAHLDRMAPEGSRRQTFMTPERFVQWRLSDVIRVLFAGADEPSARVLVPGGAARFHEALVSPAVRAMLVRMGETMSLTAPSSIRRIVECVLKAEGAQAGEPRARADLEWLTLFPAALLAEWRMRLFGEDELPKASPERTRHRKVLQELHRSVRAAGRSEAIATAFRALAEAQALLAERPSLQLTDATRARFASKSQMFAEYADIFAQHTVATR
ncbi:hypothetical protein DYI37_08015 [Fulvimarina endophytica]|uniref:Uncharacterized protein n=1 Tax=Fulvimarina endophytica TaxID=2293836 RepID=A0A371X4W7_9HYPH|nr:hypothetical protein [Fulvimarina endophytica]RFC64275.1 hypothetical protein DYI37_08015 [Fulvimarina endophytica]